MSHGGAREGSGQPPKFPGRPNNKSKRVPRDIPDSLLDQWILRVIAVKDAGYPVEKMGIDELNRLYKKITE